MAKDKFISNYETSSIATILVDLLGAVQTPEGAKFKILHTLPGTLIVNLANQTFLISITDKDDLS